MAEIERRAEHAIDEVSAREVDTDQVVASILRAAARDLLSVIELPAVL